MSFYKINPEHRRAIGSADLLMLYLHIEWKAAGKEFTRKDADLANDLAFTVRELRLFRSQLADLGVITMVKRGCPPMWYYSVNPERFAELVKNPPAEKSKKREVKQERQGGKFGPSLNRENGTLKEPLQRYNEEPSQRHILNRHNGTITDRKNGTTSLYSIDTVVDKYTDSGESDFPDGEVQYFETQKPSNLASNVVSNQPLSDEPEITVTTVTKPPIPTAKVFELSEFERDELLKNLTVGPLDLDWLLWLFDQGRPTRAIEVALLNIRGSDKVLFEKNTALYVLYAGEARWRKNLTGYLFEKKYLETPTDRRPKPKETKTERDARQHMEGLAKTYAEIQHLTKLKYGN